MNIGTKIKELRKKNDMTQEKLADYLGVSYQAVSKWECGLSSPDLSLIPPLTRLFKVSADELFGLLPEESDPMREYFDSEYFEFGKKEDKVADYELAKQAVAEYPDDFKYLFWLAVAQEQAATVTMNVDEDRDAWIHEIEESNKYLCRIVEDCPDQTLRNRSLYMLAMRYALYLNDREQAEKYAMLLPEATPLDRDTALSICYNGTDKAVTLKQKMLVDALAKLCLRIQEAALATGFTEESVTLMADTVETVIRTIIPDDNLNFFSSYMKDMYRLRAIFETEKGNYDTALDHLEKCMKYCDDSDRSQNEKSTYTAPLLKGYTVDNGNRRKSFYRPYLAGDILKDERFAPLRKYDRFKEIIK